MWGAVIGDIIGAPFEFLGRKEKNFPLFSAQSHFTDDTVLTIAVARALIQYDFGEDFEQALVRQLCWAGSAYPDAGYGCGFQTWLASDAHLPYNSFGNGSAMRVSPCGLYAGSLEQALELAERSAMVTHNHPEGVKGAKAAAAAVYLAKAGWDKEEIGGYLCDSFYLLTRTLEQIRPEYCFYTTCQMSVPQALTCFLESTDYVDAVRNAVSLGGDSDTLAAIAGGVAWTYYGRDGLTPEMEQLRTRAEALLPKEFLRTIHTFTQICQ